MSSTTSASPSSPATDRGTVEQARAAFALSCVKKWTGGDKQPEAQKYRSAVQKLPAMIMTNGLGQTVAFLMSDPDDTAARAVVSDLTAYLIEQRQIYPKRGGGTAQLADDALIECIVSGSREPLRVATEETLALLAWWVKLVRAFLPGSRDG